MGTLLMIGLAFVQADDSKVDLEQTKFLLFDQARGLSFRIRKDGSVLLEISDRAKPDAKKSSRSYTAENAEEFARLYPELVKRHRLGPYLGQASPPVGEDEFDRFWNELKRGGRGLPPLPDFRSPFDEEWEKWMEQQQGQFEELRKLFRGPGQGPAPAPAPGRLPVPPGNPRELGIKVEAVDETLRDQLSLKEDEGLMVGEVRPGSVAERSGLKTHDILLKVDGKPITDKWQFRRDAQEALGKAEFGLEILRGGKRETLTLRGVPK